VQPQTGLAGAGLVAGRGCGPGVLRLPLVHPRTLCPHPRSAGFWQVDRVRGLAGRGVPPWIRRGRIRTPAAPGVCRRASLSRMSTPLPPSAQRVPEARYLARGPDGSVVEDWEGLVARVARCVAAVEKEWGGDAARREEEF